MKGPGGPPDPGGSLGGDKRDRILRRLKQELSNVPSTNIVTYDWTRDGLDFHIVATLNLAIFADGVVEANGARVEVNWWPDDDEFSIQYIETSGDSTFTCGWHRHKNHHVEGPDHYQEEDPLDDETRYEPVEFEQNNPVAILWEIVAGRLEERVKERVRRLQDPNTKLSDFADGEG